MSLARKVPELTITREDWKTRTKDVIAVMWMLRETPWSELFRMAWALKRMSQETFGAKLWQVAQRNAKRAGV